MMGIYMEIKDKGSGREVSGDSQTRSTPRPPLQLPPRQWKWSGWWRRTARQGQQGDNGNKESALSTKNDMEMNNNVIYSLTLNYPFTLHCNTGCDRTGSINKKSRYVIFHLEVKWQKNQQKFKLNYDGQHTIIILLNSDRWRNTPWHLNPSTANELPKWHDSRWCVDKNPW